MRKLQILFNKVFRKREIETKLVEASINSKHVSVTFQNPNFPKIARILVDTFHEFGGLNFIEMKVLDPETLEMYSLQLRKDNRPTSAEIIEILREDIAAMWGRLVLLRHDHPDLLPLIEKVDEDMRKLKYWEES